MHDHVPNLEQLCDLKCVIAIQPEVWTYHRELLRAMSRLKADGNTSHLSNEEANSAA